MKFDEDVLKMMKKRKGRTNIIWNDTSA